MFVRIDLSIHMIRIAQPCETQLTSNEGLVGALRGPTLCFVASTPSIRLRDEDSEMFTDSIESRKKRLQSCESPSSSRQTDDESGTPIRLKRPGKRLIPGESASSSRQRDESPIKRLERQCESDSGPCRQEDKESDPFSGIATPADGIESCESPDKYDVFINHRGPDVKQILAIPLHDSLAEVGIQAYLDIKDNDLGDSISSKIKAAIISASVHIAIFSPRYAESAWCLAELTSMLQTGAPIIPVFYDVKSSDLRHDLRKSYADAFSYFKEKRRYLDKLEKWKESLAKVSDIVGVEATSQDNMNELCQKLVSKVKEKLAERDAPLDLEKLEVERRIIPLEVASYKVGLDRLVQDFDKHCQKLGPERGKMIGIFGLEGSGKTTLAKELFNRKCSEYTESSFLFNVREASVNGKFTSLQDKLLRDLFHTLKAINDVGNGVILLQSKLKSLSRFLIVVDGVANPKEVNSLVPLYTINSNSLVIVTAREESVLEKAGISVRYEINKMDLENGKQLFSHHAFQEDSPRGREPGLVEEFVGKCGDLPLSLQLLGGHALCTSQDTWQRELDTIQRNVPGTLNILSILELSYGALEYEEKEIFLDIVCFFIGKEVEMAKRIWKGLRWDAERALKNLRDRCLVDVVRRDLHEEPPTDIFRMHDGIREFGAKEAKSGMFQRVWRLPNPILESRNFQDILEKARNGNFRCLNSISDMFITFFLGHSMESAILQWLELTSSKCIPLEGIPLKDLEVLRVITREPRNLWKSDEAPSVLKELLCRFTIHNSVEKRVIGDNWIMYSTSLGSLSELECLILKLELSRAKTTRTPFEIKWNSFLETVMRDSHVKTLDLLGFYVKGDIDLSNSTELTRSLESLTLSKVACKDNFNVSISGKNCPALKYLKIEKMEKLIKLSLEEVQTLKYLEVLECHDLESILGNDMVQLEILCIDSCSEIEQVPRGMSALKRITIMACEKLRVIEGIEDLRSVEDITITCCTELQTITGLEQFERLKFMILSGDSMWKCFSKRLPLEFAVVMGRATTTSLDTVQIQNEMDRADYHCKFASREEGYKKLRSLQSCQQSVGAIILCAMVVSHGPTYMDRRPHFGKAIRLNWVQDKKEAMIYTIVVTDPNEISMVSHSIPGYCWMPTFHLEEGGRPLGEVQEGFILAMDKGHVCETLSILDNLTNQLYNDGISS